MHFYQRRRDIREDADLNQTVVARFLGMKQQYALYGAARGKYRFTIS